MADEFEFSGTIGHLLRACEQLHVAIWSDFFPAGLTSPQFAVLQVLARDGELNQTALRRRARLDRSSAADVVQRLVARRLVSQSRDPADGRRRVIRLTKAGQAVNEEATARARQVNDAMLKGFDDVQREQILSLLTALLDHHRGLLGYEDD